MKGYTTHREIQSTAGMATDSTRLGTPARLAAAPSVATRTTGLAFLGE